MGEWGKENVEMSEWLCLFVDGRLLGFCSMLEGTAYNLHVLPSCEVLNFNKFEE